MACFLVTTAAAIGVGAAKHITKHHEKKNPEVLKKDHLVTSKELGYLELACWGGAILLAGEHVLHEEVTFTFPFLTAVKEGPEETMVMLKEMGTVGVAMLALIVVAWFGGLLLARYLRKKKAKAMAAESK